VSAAAIVTRRFLKAAREKSAQGTTELLLPVSIFDLDTFRAPQFDDFIMDAADKKRRSRLLDE